MKNSGTAITRLPRPEFASQNTAALLADLLARFEAESGRPLYPAQIERLLLQSVAYGIDLVRADIQHTGEQNLVAYASGLHLDHLASRWGLERLPEEAATTAVAFLLTGPLENDLLISAGRKLVSKGNKVLFATVSDLIIPAGEVKGRCIARCESAGTIGNGWEPKAIGRLAIPQAEILSVSNETTSSGGSDTESDAHLRQRILAAPYGLSTAGPRDSYRLHCLGVSPDIIDVAVVGPEDRTDEDRRPGEIDIYPLYSDGELTEGRRAEILEVLNGEKVRPLCDHVQVLAVEFVTFSVTARLTIMPSEDEVAVRDSAKAALALLVDGWGLGHDIVASEIVHCLQAIAGVYSIELKSPIGLVTLKPCQQARLDAVSLLVTGVSS